MIQSKKNREAIMSGKEYETENDPRNFHGFLLNSHGGFNEAAKQMPLLREFISDIPETQNTFNMSNVPTNDGQIFEQLHFEFAGAWAFLDIYGVEGKYNRYVNPNGIHADKYPDVVVECECGGIFSNFHHGSNRIDGSGEHADDCLPHWRAQTRADILRYRWCMTKKLAWLGWKERNASERFGSEGKNLPINLGRFDTNFTKLKEQFYEAGGRTVAYAVVEGGESMKQAAEVYGVSPRTVGRWAKERSEYETIPGHAAPADEMNIETPPMMNNEGMNYPDPYVRGE